MENSRWVRVESRSPEEARGDEMSIFTVCSYRVAIAEFGVAFSFAEKEDELSDVFRGSRRALHST